jgi:HKD family nuclease
VKQLLEAIFEMVVDQHPSKIKSLSNRLSAIPVEDALSLKSFFGTDAANRALDKVLTEWQRVGCSSHEIAGLVTGASFGYLHEKQRERVELVWTGPDLKQFPVRRSEQVLLDIIDASNESLFIVSFVLVNIPVIETAIKSAVDRGVDVRMLLESEDKEHTEHFLETVDRLHQSIPGIMLYVWPREKREDMTGGFARVHAKCAVADQETAFVTSANLTSAALDKNIEMGVQINGGDIPERIYRQLTAMINEKEIVPYLISQLSTGSSSEKPTTFSLEQLPKALKEGGSVLVSFKNEKLGIEEVRAFNACDQKREKPKANTVVVINHDDKFFVGKYAWSRQQDMGNTKQFYLVSIRGFGPTQNINIDEEDWPAFFPLAVETHQ